MVKKVDDVIKESFNEITTHHNNWDGDNEIKCEIATIERAKTFLKNLILDFNDFYDELLPMPIIAPGIGGDVDLEWDNEEFYLLLSIPGNGNDLAGAYGKINKSNLEIRIDFDDRNFNKELILWLKSK